MTPSPNGSTVPFFDDRAPGRTGLGILKVLEQQGSVALPLSSVSIDARVGGRFARVRLTQVFRNDHIDPLEAVYTFPLPAAAAVSEFDMTSGGKTLYGVVAEREQARQQYTDALDQGRRAVLLEQERDDVFTVQVGNLPPGEEITVTITYSEPLTLFDSGHTELRLPLVVAPRYIGGQEIDGPPVGDGIEPDTDLVPDASRITPPRLAPGFDPDTGLRIEVQLEETNGLRELSCSQHAISLGTIGGRTTVTLARERHPLDRDFVLRWRAADESISSSLLCHRTPSGETFGALSIVAPVRTAAEAAGRDIVFVLDRSGSMSGSKMASAARACSSLLATLGPADRFGILAFSHVYNWLGDDESQLTVADEAGVAVGSRLLRSVESGGGTELGAALGEALDTLNAARNTSRVRVVVLITDGQVGNEAGILRRVQQSRRDVRIFTIGVDTAVNSGLLKRLAATGRGTCTLVEPGTALESALRMVAREIGRPLLTDLTVEGDGTIDAAPARLPDLFEGRAATIFLRGPVGGPIRVHGTRPDGSVFAVTIQGRPIDFPAIAHLWARTRVMDLEDQYRMDGADRETIKTEIVGLSVAQTVLTRFTAFIVVDDREAVVNPALRRKVVQPVAMPAAWDMAAVLPAAPSPMSPGRCAPMSARTSLRQTLSSLPVPALSARGQIRKLNKSLAELQRLLALLSSNPDEGALVRVIDMVDRILELVGKMARRLVRQEIVSALQDLRDTMAALIDRTAGCGRLNAAVRAMGEAIHGHSSTRKHFWEKRV